MRILASNENNCDRCELGQDNTNKCVICSKGYVLNSENECVECENGCLYCYLENNKQKCFICPSQTFLTEDYKCLSSLLDNCYLTEYDSINKKVICNQCNSNYVIDPTTKECKPCSEISEIGKGCDTCIYNDTSKQYECSKCSNSHCYVDNTFKCLPKTNENGLNHCSHALHIKGEKYECVQCESYNYILIKPDNTCVSLSSYDFNQNCLEYEKKNENDYSCLKCLSVYAIVEDISSHIKDCLPRVDSLSYCLEGENKNDEFSCTRCVNNSSLNNKNCVCNSDSFSKDSNWCYKCNDDKNGGIKGCNEVTGCNYDPVNKVTCNQCKDGYYKTTQGKCALCLNNINNCDKCYMNNNGKIICEKCIGNMYTLSRKDNICKLNDCDEYPLISPGCLICKNKLDEYKNNNKCQTCKYGYFKTKEEKCVYCHSEQNGGPLCYECGYETNANGIETNKIICKECYSTLTKDGKCYDCQIQFSGMSHM